MERFFSHAQSFQVRCHFYALVPPCVLLPRPVFCGKVVQNQCYYSLFGLLSATFCFGLAHQYARDTCLLPKAPRANHDQAVVSLMFQ